MNLSKNKNEEELVENKVVKKSHRGRSALLFFLVLTVGVVGVVYRFSQKPAEGTIKVSAQEAKDIPVISDVPVTFTGTYVSFMYGNTYVLKFDDLSKSNADVILEQAYLSESGAISKKINLTVRSLPSQNLTDDPDYLLRQNNPQRYKKEAVFLGNAKSVSFVPADDGQFEKTFFILHKDMVATLVMSAPSLPDEKLNKEADTIAKSLAWLK